MNLHEAILGNYDTLMAIMPSPSEWQIIRILAHTKEPVTVAQIAKATGKTEPTAYLQVSGLYDKGWVDYDKYATEGETGGPKNYYFLKETF